MVLAVGPFGLGPMELVIILLVLVMLFGATRLTDLGKSLGQGIKEFRKNVKEDDDDEEEPAAPSSSTGAPVATPQNGTVQNGTTENGAETVAAVKCAACGALNPVGARHCNQCGAAIAAPVS